MTRVLAISLLTLALFTISTSVSATAISAISASANDDFIRIARTAVDGEPEEEEDEKVELKWLTKTSIEVKNNGETDVVQLKPTSMFSEIDGTTPTEDDCLFEGTLPSDPESLVEVEGCMEEEEDTYVTIASDEIEGGIQDFVIHKSNIGKTFHITPVNGFTPELSDNPEDDAEAEAGVQSPAKFFASEYNGGLPRSVDMDTYVQVDSILQNEHGGSSGTKRFMDRVLTRAKTYLVRANVRMNLRLKGYTTTNENIQADENSIYKLARKGSSRSESYFTFSGRGGTVGIAFVGTFCNSRGYSVNINEQYTRRNPTVTTARTYAHELGHNVGMSHDFDRKHGGRRGKCDGKGIMSYGSSPDAWSTCSNEDFRAWYQRQGYSCARTSRNGRMEMEFDAWGNYAEDDDKPHHVTLTGNGTDTIVKVSGAGSLGKSAAAVFIAVLVAINSAF